MLTLIKTLYTDLTYPKFIGTFEVGNDCKEQLRPSIIEWWTLHHIGDTLIYQSHI